MKSTKKEKKQYKKAFQEAMARELREHKSSFIVFSILRILVLVVLVRQIMLANYEGAFFCILTLLLLYVPSWIQVKLRIELPPPLEITIFCFIFAAEILGEVNAFYVVIPGWDTMLHTINGFLAAAVGTTFRGISSGRMGSVSRRQAFQRGSISSGLHWVTRCPSAQVTT